MTVLLNLEEVELTPKLSLQKMNKKALFFEYVFQPWLTLAI